MTSLPIVGVNGAAAVEDGGAAPLSRRVRGVTVDGSSPYAAPSSPSSSFPPTAEAAESNNNTNSSSTPSSPPPPSTMHESRRRTTLDENASLEVLQPLVHALVEHPRILSVLWDLTVVEDRAKLRYWIYNFALETGIIFRLYGSLLANEAESGGPREWSKANSLSSQIFQQMARQTGRTFAQDVFQDVFKEHFQSINSTSLELDEKLLPSDLPKEDKEQLILSNLQRLSLLSKVVIESIRAKINDLPSPLKCLCSFAARIAKKEHHCDRIVLIQLFAHFFCNIIVAPETFGISISGMHSKKACQRVSKILLSAACGLPPEDSAMQRAESIAEELEKEMLSILATLSVEPFELKSTDADYRDCEIPGYLANVCITGIYRQINLLSDQILHKLEERGPLFDPLAASHLEEAVEQLEPFIMIEYAEIVSMMQASGGLDLRPRRHSFRMVPKTFLGIELVDWLLKQKFAPTRHCAQMLGSSMMQRGFFEHVARQHGLEDSKEFTYHFRKVDSTTIDAKTVRGEFLFHQASSKEWKYRWAVIQPTCMQLFYRFGDNSSSPLLTIPLVDAHLQSVVGDNDPLTFAVVLHEWTHVFKTSQLRKKRVLLGSLAAAIQTANAQKMLACFNQWDDQATSGNFTLASQRHASQDAPCPGASCFSTIVVSRIASGEVRIIRRDGSKVIFNFNFSELVKFELDVHDNAALRLFFTGRKDPEKLLFISFQERLRFLQFLHHIEKLSPITSVREDKIRVYINTWNMGSAPISPPVTLFPDLDCEILVVGAQECLYEPKASYNSCQADWVGAVAEHLGVGFCLVAVQSLWQVRLAVFVRCSLLPAVTNVRTTEVATGIAGVVKNKGGAVISFSLHQTSFCFVSAHLAARPERIQKRNEDAFTILSEAKQGPEDVDLDVASDFVFFFGDLNYRVHRVPWETASQLVTRGKHMQLFHFDQLKEQIGEGNVLDRFLEAPVSFGPSYRMEVGTKNYGNKRGQCPSWCDRILWRSCHPVENMLYSSCPDHITSDHTPVVATFSVPIQLERIMPWHELQPFRIELSSFGATFLSSEIEEPYLVFRSRAWDLPLRSTRATSANAATGLTAVDIKRRQTLMERKQRVRDVQRESIAASLKDTVDRAEKHEIFDSDRDDLGALGLNQLKDWKWNDEGLPVLIPISPNPRCLEMESVVVLVYGRVCAKNVVVANAVLSLRELSSLADEDFPILLTLTQGGKRAGCLSGVVRICSKDNSAGSSCRR